MNNLLDRIRLLERSEELKDLAGWAVQDRYEAYLEATYEWGEEVTQSERDAHRADEARSCWIERVAWDVGLALQNAAGSLDPWQKKGVSNV